MNAPEAKGSVAQDKYQYIFEEGTSLEETLSQYQELTGHEVRIERMIGQDFMAWMQARAERLKKEISTLEYLVGSMDAGDARLRMYKRILRDRREHLEDTVRLASSTRHEHLTFIGMDGELMVPLVGHDGEDSMSTIANEPVPSACDPWRHWSKNPTIRHQLPFPSDAQDVLTMRGEAILQETNAELRQICNLLMGMGCKRMVEMLASILLETQENLQNLIEGTDEGQTKGQGEAN